MKLPCKLTLLTALLSAPLAVLHAADSAPAPRSWSDDFSDAASFAVNWRPYGFLASGIDATHPLGKTVSGKDARPEWWQIVDGALRGQCFPEEKHPPGLRRAISGNDIRLHCRFKMAAEGQIGISIGGTPTARTISGATALVNNYFKTPGKLAYKTAPDNTVSRTLTTMVSDGTLSMTKISTIRIIPVNDAPQILASAVVAGRNGGSGVELRYDVLKAASGASDIDSPSLALVVQSVRSGLLQRWNGTAWVRISATSSIALRTLLPGKKLRWIPPATAAGTLQAFTLKASDDRLVSSTTCTVSVSLSGPT